jgi:hypothetical protein
MFSRSNAPLVRGAKNARLDGQRNTPAKSIAYDHVSMARRGNRWVIGGPAFVFKDVRAIFRQRPAWGRRSLVAGRLLLRIRELMGAELARLH